ncbi:hypothetical protein K488DRAFT_39518 [Vararia minispora EC-137]|uniref:Uncharacterized protein n=1 Tax=Vararia minispora EC-137 TaxID=1314806 RepID=A0ACB8QZH0_9AGAM|nr:hypothetical protein K488DRAFT_39518 [Vararia minispora EC-137]
MAASPSSPYAPSSSAVTIPTPGRPILKKPPPSNSSLLSRLTKFLPNQSTISAQADESRTLKRAHFILPELVTVYPISVLNPPSTPTLKEEKKIIEQRELERRRRVVRGNSVGGSDADEYWSMERVELFYRECCASREESPVSEVSNALKNASGTSPRTVDFSGVQFTQPLAATLSDVLTIEWGLRKVTFRECDLDDRILKPILHAALIPNSVTFLSVASNRRLKAPAFRLIGTFISKNKSLQFLDLSQNALDKKSIEYIAASLAQLPEQGLSSLKLDDCSLKPLSLEALAHAVRTSSLKNLSLRHNRINATGAVAVALMIRDYPDIVPGSATPTSSNPSTPPMSPSPSSAQLPQSLPPFNSSPLPARAGPLPPPPKHPSAAPQMTYTPYIPRSKRGTAVSALANPLSPAGHQIPIITSSAQGGVTTRHPVSLASPMSSHSTNGNVHHGPSAALLDKVRALDALPRLGALKTLDLRGNDLRNGVTYIAQVLKRNRTLKVLNLSENKLGVQELVSIADALKYNSCLETLDISRNPCSGPGLEGIQSLRTAFTLNNALKRLFLSSTSMQSVGAIALAEFLPESSSLLHLDLTENKLDLAGVMALSQGLKSNHVMRCLDLNIPPDDEKMAQMCREILNTCIRNTEEAEKNAQSAVSTPTSGRGQGKGLWGLIEESELARSIRKDDIKKAEKETVSQARQIQLELEKFVARSPSSSSTLAPPLSEADPDLLARARAIMQPLGDVIGTEMNPLRLEELLVLNDTLTSLLAQASPRPHLSLSGLGFSLNQAMSSPIVMAGPNGELLGSHSDGHSLPAHDFQEDVDESDEVLLTPRLDKGKGKAPPEPEVHEQVLSPEIMSPAFSFMNRGDEDDSEVLEDTEGVSTPSSENRSRWLVAEEGEVFRKGNKLLGPEEMEGEFAGEELRIELLEADVARPPPRVVLDDFGMPLEPALQETPMPPSLEESARPPPRPYISRRSSTASIRSQESASAPSSPALANLPENAAVNSTSAPNSPAVGSPGPRAYMPRRKTSSSSLEAR